MMYLICIFGKTTEKRILGVCGSVYIFGVEVLGDSGMKGEVIEGGKPKGRLLGRKLNYSGKKWRKTVCCLKVHYNAN